MSGLVSQDGAKNSMCSDLICIYIIIKNSSDKYVHSLKLCKHCIELQRLVNLKSIFFLETPLPKKRFDKNLL